MTPSGWHDDTRHRDAGHDAMQIAVWRWAKSFQDTMILRPAPDCEARYEFVRADFERPFVDKSGRILTFADVCVEWQLVNTQPCDSAPTLLCIYEVKPRIWSVGGLIRQCRAQDWTLGKWADDTRTTERRYRFEIYPVVPAADPKISDLKDIAPHTIGWSGDGPAK